MKNRHIEELKRSAKHYARSTLKNYNGGIYAYHALNESSEAQLTWWNDVSFILNDYRVLLAWIHPRMAFEEAVEEATDIQMGNIPVTEDWKDRWIAARRAVITSTDYSITPYMTWRWTKTAKLVELCAPVEVRNHNDLHQLVSLTKQLLKRETTLDAVFPNYGYTKANWTAEGFNKDEIALHTHLLTK